MLVVMRHGATDRQIQGVVQAITELGCEARQLHSAQGTTVNVVGNDERIDSARLASLDGVRDASFVCCNWGCGCNQNRLR